VPLVADLQPPTAHQRRQRPLHHIPMAAKPLARLDPAAGEPRGDPPPAQRPPAAWIVVPLVAVELGGPPTRATGPAARAFDRWDGIDPGLQQHRVVRVGRRQPDGQWDATAVDQQVVLGPALAAVCRGRAG
jgi:hypothetical protein